MSDGTFRGWWIDQVFCASSITDAVRVALLALAVDMDDAGVVAMRRVDIAARLGRSDRRVGDRISAAIEVGYLKRLSRGQRNGLSRYQAAVPGPVSSGHHAVPKTDSLQDDPQVQETDSLQDDPQVQEKSLQDTMPSSRPDLFGTPCRPEGKTGLPPQPDDWINHDPPGDGEASVIPLFEESEKTTGKNTQRAERAAIPDRFEEFWKIYPRRIAKPAARKVWDKAIKNGADPEAIIWGARAYASIPRDPADGLRYVAHPTTWLNQGRWDDEPEPAPQSSPRPSNAYATNKHHEEGAAEALAEGIF